MTCPEIERARSSHPRIAIRKQSCRDSGHEDVPHTSRLPEHERPANEPPDPWSVDDGLPRDRDSLCRCRGHTGLLAGVPGVGASSTFDLRTRHPRLTNLPLPLPRQRTGPGLRFDRHHETTIERNLRTGMFSP